jgi:hypothetical protein
MSKAISVHNNTSYTKESIDGIIADLRVVIDQIGHSQAHAKSLILELATRFDMNKACQQGQICTKIKEILSDKLKERKITGRWVERCLPAKYKGKYDKSELSSLPRRSKRNPTMETAKKSAKLDGLAFENAELKGALKRQTAILSADQVTANEIVYTVHKEKFPQLRKAMDVSRDTMRLVFDKGGVLERAEPDIYGST